MNDAIKSLYGNPKNNIKNDTIVGEIKNDIVVGEIELQKRAEMINMILINLIDNMDELKISQVMSLFNKDKEAVKYAFNNTFNNNIIFKLLSSTKYYALTNTRQLSLTNYFRRFWNYSDLSPEIKMQCIYLASDLIDRIILYSGGLYGDDIVATLTKFIDVIGCFELIQDAIAYKQSIIDTIIDNGNLNLFRLLAPYLYYDKTEIKEHDLIENVILRKDLGDFYEILLEQNKHSLDSYKGKFTEGSECHKAFERFIIKKYLPSCVQEGTIERSQPRVNKSSVLLEDLDYIINRLANRDVDEAIKQIKKIKDGFNSFTSHAVENLIKLQMDIKLNGESSMLSDLIEKFKSSETAHIIDTEEERAVRIVTIRSLLSDVEDCASVVGAHIKKCADIMQNDEKYIGMTHMINALNSKFMALDPKELETQVVNLRKIIAEIADNVNSIV